MTDFLEELEIQMTAAAHQAARKRPRRRSARAPILALAAAALAVGVVLAVARPPAPTDETTAAPVSLAGTRIGVYNATDVPGLASAAGATIRKLGAAQAHVDNWTRPVTRSIVYAGTGQLAQARRVAGAFGIRTVELRSASDRPPEDTRLRPFDVVVVLGVDFAPVADRIAEHFALLRDSTDRTIETRAGTVRVTAGGTGVCLALEDGNAWGSTCVDTTDAAAGRAVASARGKDLRLRGVAGLVPDGVTTVELERGNGTVVSVDVARNLWATAIRDIERVTFTPPGSAKTSITVP
jgi:hypothetical protein